MGPSAWSFRSLCLRRSSHPGGPRPAASTSDDDGARRGTRPSPRFGADRQGPPLGPAPGWPRRGGRGRRPVAHPRPHRSSHQLSGAGWRAADRQSPHPSLCRRGAPVRHGRSPRPPCRRALSGPHRSRSAGHPLRCHRWPRSGPGRARAGRRHARKPHVDRIVARNGNQSTGARRCLDPYCVGSGLRRSAARRWRAEDPDSSHPVSDLTLMGHVPLSLCRSRPPHGLYCGSASANPTSGMCIPQERY